MQAYLILAAREDATLHRLLEMLDDAENAIFLHVDKKFGSLSALTMQNARLTVLPRIKTDWGSDSLVTAEVALLKAATAAGNFDYYHLLSGQDLPIKSQVEIRAFLAENRGKEFIAVDEGGFHDDYRVRYFHVFQQHLRTNSWQRRLNWQFFNLQKMLHLTHNRKMKFQKGAQWFSITDDLARFVVSREDWIKKTFRKTFVADEIFLQTLILDTSFEKKNAGNQRFVKWADGAASPEVLTLADLSEIEASGALFARKFDATVDSKIIEKIKESVTHAKI